MILKSGFIQQELLIRTNTCLRKIFFIVLVLLAATFTLYKIDRHVQSDLLVAKEQTIESYTRAIAYDEKNAELWWVRGRLHHYGLENNDVQAAIQDYRRALSLNPRLGQAWMDLADCLEREGKNAEAEESLQNALKVWTYSPIVHWQAGNYYLMHGNMEKMYHHFRMAIESDTSKLAIALSTAWRVEPDPSKILSNLVPDNATANSSALSFFIARDDLSIADKAWARLIRNSLPGKTIMDLPVTFPYIDALLSKNRIKDAYRVWMESLEKFARRGRNARTGMPLETALMPDPTRNLVWNGSFEDEILDGGFDWRQQNTDSVFIQTDNVIHAKGSRSLRITFQGANVNFSEFCQILPTLSAGNYRLHYDLKTENLTTDQKPYLVIEQFPKPQGVLLRTDFFPSTSEWKEYSFPFIIGPETQAVKLSLRRSPSEKFANRIKGSLWLDDVTICIENQSFAQEKKSIHAGSKN